MSVEVVILQTEAENGVYKWIEAGSAPQPREWERAALALARQALEQRDFRAEVFLCLKTYYLVDNFEYDFCRQLCAQAREYGWGAKLYIAADERVDLQPGHSEKKVHLDTFLRQLHDGEQRATDVVLANFDRWDRLNSYHFRDLRRARNESATRYDMLPGLIIPGRWHCWAASTEYKDWLDDLSEDNASNIIIVIKDNKSASKNKAIREAKEKITNHNGRFVLACLARDDLSPGLVKFGFDNRIPILRFRGLLELRYFLLRLNRLCESRAQALAHTVESVNVERQVFFVENKHRPRLLITSAFHPETHESNCIDAAREVDIVARYAPPHSECYVQPYFRADDLTNVFKRMPELTVWLHLGHGDEKGLKDIDGNPIKLENWFARLQHSGVRLPLMFLSVCESALVARRFAEVGVGVAIGFEEKVLPEICRRLAPPVVKAALNNGGSRRAILQAYNEVVNKAPETVKLYKPKAFYSVL